MIAKQRLGELLMQTRNIRTLKYILNKENFLLKGCFPFFFMQNHIFYIPLYKTKKEKHSYEKIIYHP